MRYTNVYTQIAEWLDEKLGRPATDLELQQFVSALDSKHNDNFAKMLKGN